MTKFTVITVVYNGENDIEATIKSVINQTYNYYELIIVDGLSEDNTVKIVSQYNYFKGIKMISEPDKGIYDAMNKGLNLVTGEYIIFMNSGDVFSSDGVLRSVNNSIVKADYIPSLIYGDAFEKGYETQLFFKKSRSVKLAFSGMFAHHQAIFYNANIIKILKIYYNTNFMIAADYDFTLRYLDGVKHKNTLKLRIPICIFDLSGVSNVQTWLGFREQFIIKIKHYNILMVIIISVFQACLIIIRKYFPKLYKQYRFLKTNKF